jgi:hypothetical protein
MKIHQFLKIIKFKALWAIDFIKWKIVFKTGYFKKRKINSLSIGVATFMNRYDNCLVPLILKLSKLFPDCEIIIIANGHILKKEQEVYLKKISLFSTNFENVKLFKHNKPKGLSEIWNQIIRVSSNEDVLILNDDVDIKIEFIDSILKLLLTHNKITLLNNSWSQFLISKSLIKIIGGFDEGLKEIGGEDDDYSARLALNNILIDGFDSNTVKSKLKLKKKILKVNSYGKNMNKEYGGYSSFNSEYFNQKWIVSNSDFPGAVEIPEILGRRSRTFKYCKLRNNNIN